RSPQARGVPRDVPAGRGARTAARCDEGPLAREPAARGGAQAHSSGGFVSERFSSLFVSHGAPTLPISRLAARQFPADLGRSLPRPQAIVTISPHWMTKTLAVKSPKRFTTWHDFRGFPQELYALEYRAPGDATLRDRVVARLGKAGLTAAVSDDEKLD